MEVRKEIVRRKIVVKLVYGYRVSSSGRKYIGKDWSQVQELVIIFYCSILENRFKWVSENQIILLKLLSKLFKLDINF